MKLYLIQLVDWAFNFYFIIFTIRILFSWVNPDPYNPVVQFISKITDPVMNFMRKVLPFSMTIGMIDFSPMVAMLLLDLIRRIMIKLLWQLA